MSFVGFLIALLSVSPVFAQEAGNDTVDISNFRPPPDGMRYFAVPSASTFRHYQLGVSIWSSYANDPLVLTLGDRRVSPSTVDVEGELGDAVIDHRFMGNIQVSLGLLQHFSLSVDMPLVFWQSGYQLADVSSPNSSPA